MTKFLKHIVVIMLIVLGSVYSFAQGRRVIVQPYRHQGFERMPLPPNRPGFENRMPPPNRPGFGYRVIPNRPGPVVVAGNVQIRRIELVKENFFNRQLRLSPEQSYRFWPVYRQYQQELIVVRRLKRQNNSAAQPNGTEQINRDLAYESQILEIRKRYNDEFLRILPPEKVSLLYKSEREFTDEMIRQLGERNPQMQPVPAN